MNMSDFSFNQADDSNPGVVERTGGQWTEPSSSDVEPSGSFNSSLRGPVFCTAQMCLCFNAPESNHQLISRTLRRKLSRLMIWHNSILLTGGNGSLLRHPTESFTASQTDVTTGTCWDLQDPPSSQTFFRLIHWCPMAVWKGSCRPSLTIQVIFLSLKPLHSLRKLSLQGDEGSTYICLIILSVLLGGPHHP